MFQVKHTGGAGGPAAIAATSTSGGHSSLGIWQEGPAGSMERRPTGTSSGKYSSSTIATSSRSEALTMHDPAGSPTQSHDYDLPRSIHSLEVAPG